MVFPDPRLEPPDVLDFEDLNKVDHKRDGGLLFANFVFLSLGRSKITSKLCELFTVTEDSEPPQVIRVA
jgi:hypothetical protein